MRIGHLDHLVLTVADIDRSIAFYEDVLGMASVTFGAGRRALRFGRQQINLHLRGHEFEPKALRPLPGSADLCFITEVPIQEVLAHLARRAVKVEVGPVARRGRRARCCPSISAIPTAISSRSPT